MYSTVERTAKLLFVENFNKGKKTSMSIVETNKVLWIKEASRTFAKQIPVRRTEATKKLV